MNKDTSLGLPTLELVEKVKSFIVSCGLSREETDALNPIVLAVLTKLWQHSDQEGIENASLKRRIMELENDMHRLRSQRDALKVAVAKFQLDLENSQQDLLDGPSTRDYSSIFPKQ
ncbi:MAG: hypothetical protein ACOCXJ_04655 [Planctomycetota bacterium]